MGIEPTQSAWKAEVLPLNYTRLNIYPKRCCILSAKNYNIKQVFQPKDTLNTPLGKTGGGGRIRTFEG